jgi:hypothetical protein
MYLLFMVLSLPVVLLLLLRRRGKRRALSSPLAGLDTGARFAHRTPGRFFHPHRGF